MPQFSSQIPAPKNWQDFETICWDLWRKIWNDPDAQKNGRQGQSQHGVDIFGTPNKGKVWAGVQCKGKDNYTKQSLTKSELKSEVSKALKFNPSLSEFTVATTAPRDAKLQELARIITEEHLAKDLFSITVFFWEDIIDRLEDFPELFDKYYPGLIINTEALKTAIIEPIKDISKGQSHMLASFDSLKDDIKSIHQYNITDITSTVTVEFHAELDDARDLLRENNPKKALFFLIKLKERIWSQAPPIVKFRILTNIGASKLMLNKYNEAADLFLEASQYNPDDEKALSNTALAYLLLNKFEDAKRFAYKILEKNPANKQAYSIIVQASEEDDLQNIIEKVPDVYRNATEISYAIGVIAARKKMLIEAKKWFEIALENNGTDIFDIKGALGRVLIEIILKNQVSIYVAGLNDKEKEDVLIAIGLLNEAWELVYNTDLREFRVAWLVQRAAGRKLLCQWQEAISDINLALEVEPTNPTLIKYKAIFSVELNQNQTAINLLKDILWREETPEAAIILGDILRMEKKYGEAVSILNELLGRNPAKDLSEDAKSLLIQTCLESKEDILIEQAKNLSDSMRAENPTFILNLVIAAKISRSLGEKQGAISL